MHLHDVFDGVLERFNAATDVSVIETGTIRGNREQDFTGDGWSTLYFANTFHETVSIDLDVSVAISVLRADGLLDRVELIQGDTRIELPKLMESNRQFDIVFLDSDNNADLIFDEFQIARLMTKPRGLIVIDDVELPDTSFGALKGLRVIEFLAERSIPYALHVRMGWNGYRTGVLVVEADHVRAL